MDATTARTLNIRKIVAAAGGPTEFANRHGGGRWSQAQVSQWISEERPKPIGGRLARAIEEAIGWDVGVMDRWGSAPISGPAEKLSSSNVWAYDPDSGVGDEEVLIKESRIKFSGGPGTKPTYELVEESEPASYRRSWFQKERLKPARCIRYRVTNDSQEPFLFSGDVILVNLDETSVVDGKTYAIRYGEDLRVKKLRKRVDGLILESWNDRAYPPELLSPVQVEEHITIIGRVRDKSGRGGL